MSGTSATAAATSATDAASQETLLVAPGIQPDDPTTPWTALATATPSAPPTKPPKADKTVKIGTIVGIVIGVVVLVFIVVAFAFCVYQRKRRRYKDTDDEKVPPDSAPQSEPPTPTMRRPPTAPTASASRGYFNYLGTPPPSSPHDSHSPTSPASPRHPRYSHGHSKILLPGPDSVPLVVQSVNAARVPQQSPRSGHIHWGHTPYRQESMSSPVAEAPAEYDRSFAPRSRQRLGATSPTSPTSPTTPTIISTTSTRVRPARRRENARKALPWPPATDFPEMPLSPRPVYTKFDGT